jgi:cell division protein FtsW (lipid II flippase)
MTVKDAWRGRGLALVCAIAATVLGLVYLGAAGAPDRMLTMNLAALVAGLVVALPFFRHEPVQPPVAGIVAVSIGAALLLTALLGDEASGARRWISIAGIVLQPGLVLLPLLITAVARSRDALTAVGVVIAAVALALQPDRGMAGVLVAGLAAVVLVTRDRLGLFCLMVSIAGFAITWLRPDVVPATPFVDRVFRTAFSTGAVSGAAVWGGAVLLLVPAALGVVRDRSHRAIHAAFGATWLAIIVAAVVGDYPTPLVAYGGSSIVGYILASVGLPRGWALVRSSNIGKSDRSEPAEAPDAKIVIAVP